MLVLKNATLLEIVSGLKEGHHTVWNKGDLIALKS